MSVFLGTTTTSKVYLGTTEITKVFLGTTQVYASYYILSGTQSVYDYNDSNSSSITVNFNTDGTITASGGADDPVVVSTPNRWHTSAPVTGIGNSRWAKRTLLSGDAVSGTLSTSVVSLGSFKTISISTVGGEGRSANVLVEIYSDSGGTTKVGEIT